MLLVMPSLTDVPPGTPGQSTCERHPAAAANPRPSPDSGARITTEIIRFFTRSSAFSSRAISTSSAPARPASSANFGAPRAALVAIFASRPRSAHARVERPLPCRGLDDVGDLVHEIRGRARRGVRCTVQRTGKPWVLREVRAHLVQRHARRFQRLLHIRFRSLLRLSCCPQTLSFRGVVRRARPPGSARRGPAKRGLAFGSRARGTRREAPPDLKMSN